MTKTLKNKRSSFGGQMRVPRMSKLPLERDCKKCKKSIDINGETFYTVGKEFKNRSDQRIWFYHQDCFISMAGENFL